MLTERSTPSLPLSLSLSLSLSTCAITVAAVGVEDGDEGSYK